MGQGIRAMRVGCFVMLGCFFGGVGAWGELVDEGKIDAILEGLASGDFAKREEHQKHLEEWAQKQDGDVPGILAEMARGAEEPEVVKRLQEVARERFFGKPSAFFGFRFEVKKTEDKGGVVEVMEVIKDTAAEKAGLVRGDLLMGLDEVSFRDFEGRDQFIEFFRSQKVGEKVKFHLLRDEQEIRLSVRPGARELNEAEKAKRQEEFRLWWAEAIAGGEGD